MSQLDTLYRAFLNYRKEAANDKSCQRIRKAAKRASADKDLVESVRSRCTIEEDWICAIEEGLPFVEKAIREERQFIRQEGEVVPIEKAKRVSRASVEHLARHGNMITHVPEDEDADLIPDQLYIVENLSNYAVYENRFLYMLLCYLRDFTDLRYQKIVELGNTYRGKLSMQKTISVGKRTIVYHAQMEEEAKNDPLSPMESETAARLDRIEDIQKYVASLLDFPLMREVSHAPMLKPPITRTNALKMDNAFRHALALYDYVSAYTKPGFTVEETKKTINPFPDDMGDDFAETILLSSFLVYEYGNGLKHQLQEAYEEEEARREAERAAHLRKQLDQLRARVQKSGQSLEEYLLLLEERNRFLEQLPKQLEAAQKTIEEQENTIREAIAQQEKYRQTIVELNETIVQKEEEMKALCERHEAEIRALCEKHETEMRELCEKHEAEIAELRTQHEEELARERSLAEETLQKERDERIAERERLISEYERQRREAEERYTSTLSELTQNYETSVDERDQKIDAAEKELEELKEQRLLLQAELHGLRASKDIAVDEEDFTSEKRYKELVAELNALDQFISKQWSGAKKRIRHEYLWKKEEK